MNSFGRCFRLHIFGESHGPGIGLLIDGCPPGLALSADDFEPALARRRGGQPGTTARVEADVPRFLSGLYEGRTTGAPLALWFEHADADSSSYADRDRLPRPGHADFTARSKFGGCNDPRGGGAFSGRLTVALVAAGVVAARLLPGVTIQASLLRAGGRTDIEAAVAEAAEAGDSIGGLLECQATGLPVGLGEPFFDSVESLISHLVFCLGGVRGIAFGAGFGAANLRGSQANDPILDAAGRTGSNHAGGVNGGLTNGNPLVFKVAVKPTASIALPQRTVDLQTGEPAEIAVGGRHDACIALRFPPILEAVTACVLADLLLLDGLIAPFRPS